MEKNITTKVITGKCRLSYPHLWEPHSFDGVAEAKYGACVVIPKTDTATVAKVQAAIKAATQAGISSKWGGKMPPEKNFKNPLRDGDDERSDDPVFAGCYFINASSKQKPGVVDQALHPILDREEVYAGCYCRYSLNFFPFATGKNGNAGGVACGLNSVQKLAEGEPLSGRSRPEDDFSEEYTGDLDDIL